MAFEEFATCKPSFKTVKSSPRSNFLKMMNMNDKFGVWVLKGIEKDICSPMYIPPPLKKDMRCERFECVSFDLAS